MGIIATVAMCLLALGCSAAKPGVSLPDTLTLKTGGAPFEAQFDVKLAASGLLSVRRYGPPQVTPKTIEIHLSTEQTAMLLSLAARSTDFSVGCGQVADGTMAAMTVTYAGAKQAFSCSGAPKWPVGNNVTAFLSTLNKQLPKDLQVF